jgi:hypothetical protein
VEGVENISIKQHTMKTRRNLRIDGGDAHMIWGKLYSRNKKFQD